jgi:hypothetical protein
MRLLYHEVGEFEQVLRTFNYLKMAIITVVSSDSLPGFHGNQGTLRIWTATGESGTLRKSP